MYGVAKNVPLEKMLSHQPIEQKVQIFQKKEFIAIAEDFVEIIYILQNLPVFKYAIPYFQNYIQKEG